MKTRTIAGLLVITSVTTAVSTNAFKELKDKEAVQAIEVIQEEKIKNIRDEIQKICTDKKILENNLQAMNKMTVARGNIETSYRFSNKDQYIMRDIEGLYNMMECLWGKLTYRDVVLTAKYNYNITYDLSKINVEYKNGNLVIKLHETFVQIEDVNIDYNSAYVDENNGIFARDFTPNQTAAMISYAQTHTANYLITNQDFTNNAIVSLENNIKELCRKLNIENYTFKVYENNTLTNQDQFININTYSQQGLNFN